MKIIASQADLQASGCESGTVEYNVNVVFDSWNGYDSWKVHPDSRYFLQGGKVDKMT